MLGAILPVQGAVNQSDFLSPEDAFQYELVPDGDQLRLEWTIADDYYLYRKRMTITGQQAEPAGVEYPEGEIITDEYFGESEVYYDQAEVMIDPGEVRTLKLSWQGCADAGLCYPPQSATVTLDGQTPGSGEGGVADAGPTGGESRQAEDEFLASSLADSSLAWNLTLFFGACFWSLPPVCCQWFRYCPRSSWAARRGAAVPSGCHWPLWSPWRPPMLSWGRQPG